MTPDASKRVADSCPLPEVLAEYSVGRLPVEQVEVIAAHVAACDSCVEALDHLIDDDTLVAALRRHVPAGTPAGKPAGESSEEETTDAVRRGGFFPQGQEHPPSEPYELLEKIGQGAMGVVFKARQVGLKRLVALKMALSGSLLSAEARARLRTEGEAIARLEHPNIVRVHDCGDLDGRPYFSMELIEGQSLAQKLAAGPLPEREAAELVRTLALAVSFAHQKDVIHRDLKPANILLDASGAVKLTDFGLAKLLDVDTGQTQPDTVMGTASYAAPEQARGDIAEVGPPADVYGLGAILYETLTCRPPFRAATRSETLQQVRTQDPVPPSRLRRRLCRNLEAVCLTCLEKSPSRRYPSAMALAEDLGRWLRDGDTLVRPPGPFRRIWKTVRRRPLRVAGMLGCVLAIVAAALAWNAYEATPERGYQRSVAPLLAQLQKGEAVELIQPGGRAPAFRVRCGEGITKARMTEDGFVVTSPSLGLVELLPRVPVSRYRLHAELRHDWTRFARVRYAGVGVTYTHRTAFSPEGTHHVIAGVVLNDWDQRPRAGKQQSPALLRLTWFLDTPTDGQSAFPQRFCHPPEPYLAWYSSPAARDGIPHVLDIDVAPEGTTAVLGDSPEQPLGPLRPEVFDRFSNILRTDQKEAKDVDLGPLNQPAIGVVVSGGQCTVRRLRIVPQSEPVQ
jgi:serine/threonine-protein kinase